MYPRSIRGTTAALRPWLLTSVPTPICLCKPFSCKACPGSALPGAVVIRNDSATHRRRSGKSRRPVSTNFRPEQAKEDTAGEAQLTNSCRRARLGALPARCGSCRLRADFCRPSFPRVLRSEFSDSRGWILLGLACPIPFSTPRFVKPHARAENVLASDAANAYPCRAEALYTAPSRAGRPSGVRLSEMTSCGRDSLPARGFCGD